MWEINLAIFDSLACEKPVKARVALSRQRRPHMTREERQVVKVLEPID